MDSRSRRMLGHGAVVMLIGLIAGFGLIMSLIGGFEVFPGKILNFEVPGDASAWARTHLGGITNGMMVILFALFMHVAALPQRQAGQLYWMLVGTGYANTAFYWGGLLSPSRALTIGDNPHGESTIFGVLGFLPALVFAIVLLIAMVIVIRWAFSRA
ncbi:MAG: styrene-oxide isomerase StyC [Sinimarinibacterium flocculans]|uniref:styrene-oxide isomerase StyC n=1 Tax=Sinimarinibacterium flocculans TaxID=985250 RepID=UPI003C35DFAE